MNETKQNIIIQALKFFAENDYDRASLNSIAKALGVTKGAIYHYFDSKDGLFKEVIRFISDSLDTFYERTLPPNPTAKDFIFGTLSYTDLEDVMKRVWGIDVKIDYMTFVTLMFSGMKKFPGVKEKLQKSYTPMVDMLEAVIEKEKGEGKIKQEVNPRIVALEVTALAEGAVLMLDFFSDADRERVKLFAQEIWNRIKV